MKSILGTNQKDYGNFVSAEELIKSVEGWEIPKTPRKIEPIVRPTIEPVIATSSQTNLPFWTIPEVTYRGKTGSVDILNGFLDNKSSKTQDEWASYSEEARSTGDFYTPDYPLLYATLKGAFESRSNPSIEEMRLKLKDMSRASWIMTLTRIAYKSKEQDRIIHNFGMSDKYESLEDFVGEDGVLPAGSPEKVYQSLLGTSDPLANINKTFNWLNDTQSNYILRVNQKPKKVDVRVTGLIAYSDYANLYCYGNPTISGDSLGVRFCAEGASIGGKR